MTKKTLVTVKKTIEHPLEDVFDIEPCTTQVERVEQQTELVPIAEYDAKDSEIEGDFQEVYDKAMSGYEKIQDECEDIEGRYLPRMMEVGVQHLNMALAAAGAKARLKEMKDKLNGKKPAGPSSITNNIVMGREELLRRLFRNEDDDDELKTVERRSEDPEK